MSHHADEERRYRAHATAVDPRESRLLEDLDELGRESRRIEDRLAEMRRQRAVLLQPALRARRALLRSWRHLRWDAQKIRTLEQTVHAFFGARA